MDSISKVSNVFSSKAPLDSEVTTNSKDDLNDISQEKNLDRDFSYARPGSKISNLKDDLNIAKVHDIEEGIGPSTPEISIGSISEVSVFSDVSGVAGQHKHGTLSTDTISEADEKVLSEKIENSSSPTAVSNEHAPLNPKNYDLTSTEKNSRESRIDCLYECGELVKASSVDASLHDHKQACLPELSNVQVKSTNLSVISDGTQLSNKGKRRI